MLSCKAAPAPAERPSRLVSSRDSAAVFGTALKTSANAKTSEPVCGTALYAMLRVPGGHLAGGRRPGRVGNPTLRTARIPAESLRARRQHKGLLLCLRCGKVYPRKVYRTSLRPALRRSRRRRRDTRCPLSHDPSRTFQKTATLLEISRILQSRHRTHKHACASP